MTTPESQVAVGGARIVEAQVVFTTKELLTKIDGRFDRLEVLAEGAATRADVDKLNLRVNALEQDASGTKAVAKALLETGSSRWSKNEKIIGLGIAAMAAIPALNTLAGLFQ